MRWLDGITNSMDMVLEGFSDFQTLGDSDGQRGLACCSSREESQRVRHDLLTEQQEETYRFHILPSRYILASFLLN